MPALVEVAERRRLVVGRKGTVWSILSPAKTMQRVSKEMDLNVTPYMCRHFFATRCLESVDVPTVAKWLGHQDGGVLLLQTYSHVNDEHGMASAQKVKCG